MFWLNSYHQAHFKIAIKCNIISLLFNGASDIVADYLHSFNYHLNTVVKKYTSTSYTELVENRVHLINLWPRVAAVVVRPFVSAMKFLCTHFHSSDICVCYTPTPP
jgi:hypothetical protein